ncbi:hypothetical protein NBRC116494_22940 [Aurantivibrio plasticivorans]
MTINFLFKYTQKVSSRLRILLILTFWCTNLSYADKPTFEIIIENHLFIPSEVFVPANTKVKLIVHNNDPTPEEFESYELNREKVVMGKQKAVIFIGPLKPGKYPFFGEFFPTTAQGTIIAVDEQ